jgi:hypothetical protein
MNRFGAVSVQIVPFWKGIMPRGNFFFLCLGGLREWVSQILTVYEAIMDKLAELISQKLLHLEEQLFTVICNLTVIWYNPTYAYTCAFKKAF